MLVLASEWKLYSAGFKKAMVKEKEIKIKL